MLQVTYRKRSGCPVSGVLDVIGDKWTLLVVRDMMFLKKKSFKEFSASGEGIATNILTDRLKRLEDCGIIKRSAYSQSPVRYEYKLTKRGKDLRPLLKEMARWGLIHIKGCHQKGDRD
jgi:DNA-binding HxlR family transcriptional regulator